MTKEEAIDQLQDAKDGYKEYLSNEAIDIAIKALEQEPTTKNNLGVDCIDRAELLKAMDTWDKFGDDPNKGLIPLRTPTLQDKYVPYVKYDDMINCVKGMPPVTSQEPRWIPVSERYPKPEDEYKMFLVTDDKGVVSVQVFYLSIEKEPQPYFSGMINVIAWMPLPKAYREVVEE